MAHSNYGFQLSIKTRLLAHLECSLASPFADLGTAFNRKVVVSRAHSVSDAPGGRQWSTKCLLCSKSSIKQSENNIDCTHQACPQDPCYSQCTGHIRCSQIVKLWLSTVMLVVHSHTSNERPILHRMLLLRPALGYFGWHPRRVNCVQQLFHGNTIGAVSIFTNAEFNVEQVTCSHDHVHSIDMSVDRAALKH